MSVAVGVGKTARDISSRGVDPKANYMVSGWLCVFMRVGVSQESRCVRGVRLFHA